jgi:FSR family fosmidomycin resistance protein-like MFS transporter
LATRFLLLTALGHFTIEACNNFLPVLYPVLIDTLGLTYAQVGVVTLVAGMGVSLTQPLFGLLSDRWNARRLVLLSVLWSGVGMALVGFAWSYWALVLIVSLGSLGSAAFHPSGAMVASAAATKRRGAAISIFSVGGNLGSALSPLLVAAGIAWLGMQGTLVLVPIAVAASLFLYFQLEPVAASQSQPAPSGAPALAAVGTGSLLGLSLVVVAMLFRSWFMAAFMTYLPTWIQEQGQSLASGGQMLSMLLVCVGAGSLIGGALSDRIGRWQVLVLSLSLLAPAQWLFLSTTGLTQLAMLGLIGIFAGTTFPVSIVLAQEAFPRGRGVASGFVIGFPWVGGGLGASLTGLLADNFSLTAGLHSLALPAVLAAVSMAVYGLLWRSRRIA